MTTEIKYHVIINEHPKKIEGKRKWIRELMFYQLSGMPDLSNDWRFKEVKDHRKECIILGTCTTSLPIDYPLTLDNGIVINEDDYHREEPEDLDIYED